MNRRVGHPAHSPDAVDHGLLLASALPP